MKTLLRWSAAAGAFLLLVRRQLRFEAAMREWATSRDRDLRRFADELNDDWQRFGKEVHRAFERASR